jgi:hypothetical protein
LIAVVSGAALMYDGAVVVAYEGFVPSVIKLVGLLLLAVWTFVMAVLMWRYGGRGRPVSRSESAHLRSADQPVGQG